MSRHSSSVVCLYGALLLTALGAGCGSDDSGSGVARDVPAGSTPGQPVAGSPAGSDTALPAQVGGTGMNTMGSNGQAAGTTGAGAPMMAGSGSAAPPDGMMPEDTMMVDPGMAGSGGALAGAGGTSAGMPAPASPDTCPSPRADAPALAIEAWTIVNEMRLAAGAGCMNLVPELIASAQGHCDYRAANAGNRACLPDGHTQVMGCTGYTGRTAQEREVAAGYPRNLAYTEVYVSYGDPGRAIQSWLDTVYHRIPLYDPWTSDMGYGSTAGCDVIDIGRGMSTVPADSVVVYPYDGQTDVPPSWSGLEAPQPPAPSGGWPSSYPINIYAQDIRVDEHVLTRDGDGTVLEHVWLDASSPSIGGLRTYFSNTAFLYGAPFEANTTYRVRIAGMHAGGTFDVEWTFTTGERRPFGF